MNTLASSSARLIRPTLRPNYARLARRKPKSLQVRYSTTSAPPPVDSSLTSRLRRLSRENGKVALGVYLGLSLVDFGVTFLAVYSLGAEHVHQAEDWVLRQLDWRRKKEGEVVRKVGEWAEKKQAQQAEAAQDKVAGSALWTTALLAYTIHKTLLLPFRIGVTAAVTPAVVR